MPTSEAMAAADAAWLHMDRPTNRMTIVAVLVLERPLELARLRRLIARRLVMRHPRFRAKVTTGGPAGGPRWEEDPHFDLALHVHHVALPAPGGDAALQRLVADLASTDLDRDRPLWDVHLVDGVGDGCALVVRLHHCIADGIALARVLLELTDGGRRRTPPAHALEHSGPSLLTRAAGLPFAAARRLAPRSLVGATREAAADAVALAQLLGSPPDPPGPLKGDHGQGLRVAWTAPIDLAGVKAIAHAAGATVNDVLLAALAGALAPDLQHDGEPEPRFHAVVPFDVRDAAAPMSAELGNRFGLVFVRLPVAEATPGERLAAVQREMAAIKASRQPAVSYAALRALGLAPAPVEARLMDFFSAKGTAVVTDVRGPERTIRLGGAAVSDAFIWAPCAGSVGASVSIFSYRGTIRVGMLAHAGLHPAPARVARHFAAEVAALQRDVAQDSVS